jgi:hypothetical protein
MSAKEVLQQRMQCPRTQGEDARSWEDRRDVSHPATINKGVRKVSEYYDQQKASFDRAQREYENAEPPSDTGMTRKQAEEKAMDIVFVSYNIGDIKDECKRRGIKTNQSRSKLEHALIEAMTKEFQEATE